ncbi:hypothetical protein ACFX19_028769 [Malus domestica]
MADDGSTPAVSVHLACLILVLLCKLDMKADICKDVSLSYLFLANNLHFIVENAQQTPSLLKIPTVMVPPKALSLSLQLQLHLTI